MFFRAEVDEEEDLEELPLESKNRDPWYKVKIQKEGFNGVIYDIERGRTTKEILYLIRYEDGDQEHLTADQVQEFLEPTVVVTCHMSVETEADAILVTCMALSGNVIGKFHTDTAQVLQKML